MVKKISIGLGIFILILVGGSYLLPSKMHVQRTIFVECSQDVVYDLVNNFRNWQSWSPWKEEDSDMVASYTGPESGKGAKQTWKSEKSGNGSMEIIDNSPPDMVRYDVSFTGEENWLQGKFEIKQEGNGSNVVWSFYSKEPSNNPISRIMSFIYTPMVEKSFEKGLKNIKEVCEKQ